MTGCSEWHRRRRRGTWQSETFCRQTVNILARLVQTVINFFLFFFVTFKFDSDSLRPEDLPCVTVARLLQRVRL